MKVDSLVKFFKHVAERETSHGISDSFKFKSVLSSRKKGTLLPARYKHDEDAAFSEPENIPAPARRRKRIPIHLAQETIPLFINNMADTLPITPISVSPAVPFNGLYTPGDTPAPDDNNLNTPAKRPKILPSRSRLPLTPDGTPADALSPSAPRRSKRSTNVSSPLNPTTDKKKKLKKKRH